jgi:hypothetical protein
MGVLETGASLLQVLLQVLLQYFNLSLCPRVIYNLNTKYNPRHLNFTFQWCTPTQIHLPMAL